MLLALKRGLILRIGGLNPLARTGFTNRVYLISSSFQALLSQMYTANTVASLVRRRYPLGFGYQCRWNYVSLDDIHGVQKSFDKEDFPDPVEMTNEVATLGRKVSCRGFPIRPTFPTFHSLNGRDCGPTLEAHR